MQLAVNEGARADRNFVVRSVGDGRSDVARHILDLWNLEAALSSSTAWHLTDQEVD